MYPITIIISLHINSLVEKLRGVGVGVECRGRVVAALAHLIAVLMQYGKKGSEEEENVAAAAENRRNPEDREQWLDSGHSRS